MKCDYISFYVQTEERRADRVIKATIWASY